VRARNTSGRRLQGAGAVLIGRAADIRPARRRCARIEGQLQRRLIDQMHARGVISRPCAHLRQKTESGDQIFGIRFCRDRQRDHVVGLWQPLRHLRTRSAGSPSYRDVDANAITRPRETGPDTPRWPPSRCSRWLRVELDSPYMRGKR